MKKTAKVTSKKPTSDLKPEYRFDYSKSKPKRFAGSRVVKALPPK